MNKEELYNIVFDTPELKEYVENKDKEIERLKEEIDSCDIQRRVIKDLNKSLTEVHKEKDRLKNIINKIKSILHNSIEYNALTKLALIEESLQGDDK